MTDIWVQYWVGNKRQDPFIFGTRSKYRMNINGRHFRVCYSFRISSMDKSRVKTVRNVAPSLFNNGADRKIRCCFMKGAAMVGVGNNAENAERNKKNKQTTTKKPLDIHILWTENPTKGEEASPTTHRISSAVNLSFNISTGKLNFKSKNDPQLPFSAQIHIRFHLWGMMRLYLNSQL